MYYQLAIRFGRSFYMGKNTPNRQEFIIDNLREDVDKQVVEA